MTAALEQHDWSARLARRTRSLGGGEITAILALAGATDVITFSGGFPDPATFPAGLLAEIAARLIAADAGVALQYSATEGLASVRDYVSGRLAATEGRAPSAAELMITSGGIDCMELLAKSYVDPGDVVVVEAPTYLGGIMAFRGYEADCAACPSTTAGCVSTCSLTCWPPDCGRRSSTRSRTSRTRPGCRWRPTAGRSWSRWPAGTGS